MRKVETNRPVSESCTTRVFLRAIVLFAIAQMEQSKGHCFWRGEIIFAIRVCAKFFGEIVNSCGSPSFFSRNLVDFSGCIQYIGIS